MMYNDGKGTKRCASEVEQRLLNFSAPSSAAVRVKKPFVKMTKLNCVEAIDFIQQTFPIEPPADKRMRRDGGKSD